MAKYLKMSDCFDVPVYAKKRSSVSTAMVDCNGYEIVNFFHELAAECVSHAINSHDELVAMNKELLAALEWSDAQIMEFISIAFRHAEVRGDFELSDVRDALNMVKSSAISKYKGGAA